MLIIRGGINSKKRELCPTALALSAFYYNKNKHADTYIMYLHAYSTSELEDKEYDLEYIQAWLAHPYTEKYFQMQGSDFENGFTARGTFLLKKLPFIKLNFSDAKQKKLYDDVVLKTRKIYALNEQMIKRPDKASVRVLEKEKNRIIVEIQDLIGKVYRQEI